MEIITKVPVETLKPGDLIDLEEYWDNADSELRMFAKYEYAVVDSLEVLPKVLRVYLADAPSAVLAPKGTLIPRVTLSKEKR